MSTQAPAREEQRPEVQPGIVERPAVAESPFVEMSLEEDDSYPILRPAVLAAMGATTLMSVGALLGARFISRRVRRGRRSIRVRGGSPRLLIMLPFTAINFYGRRSRRFALPRVRVPQLNIRRAGGRRVRTMTRLPARLQHRLAGC